jgi:hypothetical protein
MAIQNLFDFSKWTFLTATMFLLLGAGFFLQGCDKMRTTEEEKIPVRTKANSTPSVVAPPIDSSSSLKTETATFALG